MGHIEKIGSMELLKRHWWITLELKFHKDWICDSSELVQVFNIPLKLNPFPKTQKKRSSIYKINQPIEIFCKIDNLCFSWEQIGFPSNTNLTRNENRNTKFSITLILQWVYLFLSLWLFANRLDILWQIVPIVLSFSSFDFLPLFSSYQHGRYCFYTNYVSISISLIATTKVEPIDPNFKRGFSHQLVGTPLLY
jgi:hypothetical protein